MTAVLLFGPLLYLPSATAAQEPLRAAVLTELSGPGAVIGEDCRHGIEAGKTAFDPAGSALRIIFGDSRDDASAGITEFSKLVEQDRAEIVLVTRSKIALPLSPVAARMKIPLIGGVGHPDFLKGSPFSIRLFPSAALEGRFLAQKAFGLGLKRLALITLQDDWTLALSSEFKQEFIRLGGVLLSDQELLPADTNFSAAAAKIKQLRPDGIFVNVLLGQAGPLVKRLRESGLNQRLISNYWIQTGPTVAVAGSQALEGTIFAQVETGPPKFAALFRSKFPQAEITPAAYLCYAAVAVLAELQKERAAAAPAAAQDLGPLLTRNRTVELLDSRLLFRDREGQLELVLKTLKNGKVIDLRQ